MRPLLSLALAAATATITATGGLLLAPSAQAQSGDDAKIEARVSAWGRNCKNAVAEKFKARSMADVTITLGETLKSSIDAGDTKLSDIQRGGLSFNFRVKSPGKDPEGYCNTDGRGNVTEIVNLRN